MPNIQELKRDARRLAESKGHEFRLLAFESHPDDGTKGTATCIKCGATVTIGVYPVSTTGEAIEQDCGGEKC